MAPHDPGQPQIRDHSHTAITLTGLLLCASLLLPVLLVGGAALQGTAVPAMSWVLEAIAPELQVRRMAVDSVAGERRVSAVVTLASTAVVGDVAVVPDPRGEASAFTPAGHALLAPWVAAVAALAWPASRVRERLWRATLLLPTMCVLLVIDPPLMLASAIWQLLVDGAAPGTWTVLGSVAPFLLGGGRVLLGLGAAGVLVMTCVGCGRGANSQLAHPAHRVDPVAGRGARSDD